jgi:hypothetical protein
MNRLSLSLLALALVLAACSSAGSAPTSAPTQAVESTAAVENTAAVALTAVPATVLLPTLAPAATEAVVAPASTAQPAATLGGPIVITVLPANGTAPAAGTPALPAPTAVPSTPLPTLPGGLPPTELKYRVLAAFPNLFFCDPDLYPVARGDEGALAQARFPSLQANAEEFAAIVAHNHLAGVTAFASDQQLLVYREHKKLEAVRFELAGSEYQFQLQTKDPSSGKGLLVTGRIDGTGATTAVQTQPSIATCPVCLAAQTRIDTPRGAVVVTDLRPGDLVWTVDASGARVAAPILQMVRVPVPATHQMVHLTLADGRELWASPGHPTSDGRQLGDLAAGSLLDGARILTAERVPYGQPATYDLLPASATGFYWANGILMGSTLKP